jgi:hypothetical protein
MSAKHFITVTREVHRALAKHAIGQLDQRDTVYHANGTVTFSISDDVYAELMAISRDPELAVRKLLNMGADA